MKQNRITIYIDLFFCVILLPVTITVLPVDKWFIHDTGFMVTLLVYLYLLYFTYRKTNIPALVMKRKYATVVAIIAVLLIATALLSHYPVTDRENARFPVKAKEDLRIQTVWFLFLIVTGFAFAIELMLELFRQILTRHRIEDEKNKAELALYKSQINPHFMFNTLNTLYALVISGSENTESAFMKFSGILKYMYSQTDSETIGIDSEMDYIQQYIDLQKLRLNHHTKVLMQAEIDDHCVQIPPMILITFVENAFKYGTSSEEDCNISFRLTVKDGTLTFSTSNRIMRQPDKNKPAIGLENCRKRLEVLYPGRFSLTTDDTGGIYRSELTLKLK